MITDNGKQFTSDDFGRFCKSNGINHILTAPYHQSSNGQAERFVQTIKRGLKLNNVSKGCTQRNCRIVFREKITVKPLNSGHLRD